MMPMKEKPAMIEMNASRRRERLLTFSCRTRQLCPSCGAKRGVIFGAFLREEVVEPVGHAQWVFTIPKILRAYFLRNRELLGDLSRSNAGIAGASAISARTVCHAACARTAETTCTSFEDQPGIAGEHAKRCDKLGISHAVESNAKCFFRSLLSLSLIPFSYPYP